MNVLVIASGAFAPNNVIGAIRWTKICKYLAQTGETITVLAQDNYTSVQDEILMKDAEYCDEIVYISEGFFLSLIKRLYIITLRVKGLTYKEAMNQYRIALLSRRLIRTVGYYDFFFETKRWLRHNHSYDVAISTNPLGAHWSAEYANKKYHIPWIADFRDPIAPINGKGLYRKWLEKCQNKIIYKADSIIAISKGLKETLCRNNIGAYEKTYVIYNGFDSDDSLSSDRVKNGKIRFVYTGILYTGKRDLRPLFQAFRELCDSGFLNKDDIIFDYAGDDYKILYDQASKFRMEDVIIDHGFIPRRTALELQAAADVLVMATYSDPGNPGVMTGKVYEYMMMKKPILAIISGTVPEPELKIVLNECDAGFCYESGFDKIDKLKVFLAMIIDVYYGVCELPYKYNVDAFDYRNIAIQVNELIKSTIG